MIALQGAIKFNGGGHINHSIFWTNLAPPSAGGGRPPTGVLADAISREFVSFDAFKGKFKAQALGVQVRSPRQRVRLYITRNIRRHPLTTDSAAARRPPPAAFVVAAAAAACVPPPAASPTQGSGWAWLVFNVETGRVEIQTRPNQDPVHTVPGLVPLLGVDVWEHAYYLDYKNVRGDYIDRIWSVVNWGNVAERYQRATAPKQ